MRESRLFIILISLVMGLAGCSKETMIGEYVDRCAVRLDIDWGPCGIDPDAGQPRGQAERPSVRKVRAPQGKNNG